MTARAELAADDDAYVTSRDTALTVPAPGVLANDVNPSGAALRARVVSGPAHGTLTFNEASSFTYTPAADFSGADGFSYQAELGDGTRSNVANVTITVRSRPTAGPDAYSTMQDTPLTVTAPGVLADDTSGSGDPLTARLADGPAHGTVTLGADGSFTYTPTLGYSGPDAFT